MSEIMAKVYPVKWSMDTPRRVLLDQLESALHNWMIELPDALRYHETGNRTAPPPHVLILHAEYYSALLLLYRALCVLHHYPSTYTLIALVLFSLRVRE